jgi:hypothetical protein
VITQQKFEFLGVAVQERLSPVVLQHQEFVEYMDHALDSMVWQIRGYVLGQRRKPITFTSTYWTYASWWQHTKAVHFPTLSNWLNRQPRMVEHRIDHDVMPWVTYPEAPRVAPDNWGAQVMQFIPDSDIQLRVAS